MGEKALKDKKHELASQDKSQSEAYIMPLGSGGWIPVKDRHTACYIFQKNETLVFLDFGTGVARLIGEHDYILNGIERVIGFVSHYHTDHIMGLFYFPSFFGVRHLELYAPGKDLYGSSAGEILEGIFSPPQLPRKLRDFIPSLSINDIPMDGMKIDGLEFKFRAQMSHVHPSVAVRIGDHVTYCTDTEPDYETIGFAMGSNLLLHECWYADKMPVDSISPAQVKDFLGLSGKDGHSSNLAVGLIAREARVKAAATIHHNPKLSQSDIQKMAGDASLLTSIELKEAQDSVSMSC